MPVKYWSNAGQMIRRWSGLGRTQAIGRAFDQHLANKILVKQRAGPRSGRSMRSGRSYRASRDRAEREARVEVLTSGQMGLTSDLIGRSYRASRRRRQYSPTPPTVAAPATAPWRSGPRRLRRDGAGGPEEGALNPTAVRPPRVAGSPGGGLTSGRMGLTGGQKILVEREARVDV
jgi:hypothetical protein